MMALIWGVQSKFPCPVCLVPKDEQSNLSKLFPLRSASQSQYIVGKAEAQERQADAEELLKAYGLRGVKVSNIFRLHK